MAISLPFRHLIIAQFLRKRVATTSLSLESSSCSPRVTGKLDSTTPQEPPVSFRKKLIVMATLAAFVYTSNSAFAYNTFSENSAWQPVIAPHQGIPPKMVAVDKKRQQLFLFERNLPLKINTTYLCTTGQMPGDKVVEGDLKTPEGVYFVLKHLTSGLDFAMYGYEAYTLNYPNPVDRLRRKTGHGIWIHGRGTPIAPLQTQGCISLNNKDIAVLGKQLDAGTPVILSSTISQSQSIINTEAIKVKKIGNLVHEWNTAWAARSNTMFNYYDANAYSAGTESFSSFKANKERLFKGLPWIKSSIKDLQILQGPGYWVTWFYQDYEAPNLSTQGVRRLYWGEDKKGSFKIIGMEWESGQKTQPLVAVTGLESIETASLMPGMERVSFDFDDSHTKKAEVALLNNDSPQKTESFWGDLLPNTAISTDITSTDLADLSYAVNQPTVSNGFDANVTPDWSATITRIEGDLFASVASIENARIEKERLVAEAKVAAETKAKADAEVAEKARIEKERLVAEAKVAAEAKAKADAEVAEKVRIEKERLVAEAKVVAEAKAKADAEVAEKVRIEKERLVAEAKVAAEAKAKADAEVAEKVRIEKERLVAEAKVAAEAKAKADAEVAEKVRIEKERLVAEAKVAAEAKAKADAEVAEKARIEKERLVAEAKVAAEAKAEVAAEAKAKADAVIAEKTRIEKERLVAEAKDKTAKEFERVKQLQAEAKAAQRAEQQALATAKEAERKARAETAKLAELQAKTKAAEDAYRKAEADLQSHDTASADGTAIAGALAQLNTSVQSDSSSTPTAGKELSKDEQNTNEILTLLEQWRSAWLSGSIDAYGAFYAPRAVQGSSRSVKAIKRQKKSLWATATPTSVQLQNIKVKSHSKNVIVAEMLQIYKDASGKGDKGLKTLRFEKINNRFLITEEKWSPVAE